MFGRINRCDIYVGLSVLYILQGALYQQGIINQVLQVVLLSWAIIVAAKEIRYLNHGHIFLRATTYLIALYLAYGVAFIVSGKVYQYGNGGVTSTYGYLQSSLNSLLPIFLFYHYTGKGYLTQNRIVFYGLLFLASFMVDYSFNLQQMIAYYSEIGSKRVEFTNNSSYLFLLLFPFLYFYRSKWIQIGFLITIFYFLLIGMKRGAVLIGVLCVIIFLAHKLKRIKHNKNVLIYIMGVFLVFFSFYTYMKNTLSGSEYFIERVQQTLEGDSSGRDVIYSAIWNSAWNSGDLFHLVFGKGANSTIEVTDGWFAHQDWLETLCDTGLIGIFILISFYVAIFKECLRAKRLGRMSVYQPFFLMFVICLFKSFFSMSIQDMQVCQTMILGYCSYHVKL